MTNESEAGQALVEFALVLGLLIFMMLGMITLGLWFSAQQTVNQAAKLGAREASLTLDNERVRSAVFKSMRGLDETGRRTSVFISPESPFHSKRVRGEYITVKVIYSLPVDFRLFKTSLGSRTNFSVVKSESSSRIECLPVHGNSCDISGF